MILLKSVGTENFHFISRNTFLDLHGELLSLGLLDLGDLGGGLVAQRAASPVLLDLLATLVVVSLDGLDQLVQRGPVVRLDLQEKIQEFGLKLKES